METLPKEEEKTIDIVDGEEQEKKKKKKKKKNKKAAVGEEGENEEKPQAEEEEKKGDAEDKEEGEEDGAEEGTDGPAKKKKKRNKKKKGGAPIANPGVREQDNSYLRLLGSWAASDTWKQSVDYTVPVSAQFPNKKFPEGEWMNHPGDFNTKRTTDTEYRSKDLLHSSKVNDLRKAAECHRQVRKEAQTYMRPGVKLIDICERIEACNKRLVEQNGLEAGIAFPTGCSINHCAAHYTPNPGDDTVLGVDDVMKIDFGTHLNGHIIDCAFTVAFNPTFDPLLLAVKEATNEGIKQAGIDVRLCDIGEAI